MHLNAPQEEKIDCQSLLNFFDYFPQIMKFAFIKKTDFVLRPSYASRRSAKVKIYEFEEFEIPNNLVDHEVVKDRKIKNRKVKDRTIKDDNGLDEYDLSE